MAKAFFVSVAALCAALGCTGCAMDPAVVSIWGGDLTVPKLVKFDVVSENELAAAFTAPVSVSRAGVVLPDSGSESLPVSWQASPDGLQVAFSVADRLGIGTPAVFSAMVKDAHGNTLSFDIPYTGFNNRVPVMKINEIRTEYSKPKVEYVELYVLKGGNLSGVAIQNPMNAIKPVYEFPSVEVAAGEYIVYHLRSVEEGLVDETGAVDVSAGTDARSGARDFWDNLTKSPLKKTNALLLRERNGGSIMDAFLSAEADATVWPNDAVHLAAEEAFSSGAWKPGALVSDAFCSTGTTLTRTIGRNERSADTDLAADWKICPTSKCSPGETNVVP